jgi:hypothetical protein
MAGYNGQITVDAAYQVITAHRLSKGASETGAIVTRSSFRMPSP